MIKINQLRAGINDPPDNLEEFIDPLNRGFARFGLISLDDDKTILRIASFLGQYSVETDNFKKMREIMYYKHHPENKIPRLYDVFKNNKMTVFSSPEEALKYEEKPEACANKVYANILGNGNEASGDGYKFRGGGLPHLTGKGQYNLCGVELGIDLLNHPELIETPEIAVLAGCWYWRANNLNRYADTKSFELLTGAINKARFKIKERITAIYRFISVLEKKWD